MSGSAYPFITKDGTLGSFKTISTDAFSQFQYGDIITGSYPLTATIGSDPYVSGQDRPQLLALKNTLNYYCTMSPHYAFSSSLGDKGEDQLRLISIPSIFYGSSIRKGSVSCKFYLTGTLIAELNDENENGELIQVGPSGSTGSGSVAGVVLYREGFVILTGSWDLHPTYTDNFNIYEPADLLAPSWKYFFTTGSGVTNLVPSSSFGFTFEGVQHIPTLTMMAHAPKGELNHSNNPTYIEYGQDDKLIARTSSFNYYERDDIEIANISKTPYVEEEPKFEKITYISKIGIYDDNHNLIGIAKVATPVRKREIDSYTFKLKLDM